MSRKLLVLLLICLVIVAFCTVDAKSSYSRSSSSYTKSYSGGSSYSHTTSSNSYSKPQTYSKPVTKSAPVVTTKPQTYTKSSSATSQTVVNNYHSTSSPAVIQSSYGGGGMGILDYLLISQLFNNHQQPVQQVQPVVVQGQPSNVTYIEQPEPTPTQESPLPIWVIVMGIFGAIFVIKRHA